jgi:hypothetical protein
LSQAQYTTIDNNSQLEKRWRRRNDRQQVTFLFKGKKFACGVQRDPA